MGSMTSFYIYLVKPELAPLTKENSNSSFLTIISLPLNYLNNLAEAKEFILLLTLQEHFCFFLQEESDKSNLGSIKHKPAVAVHQNTEFLTVSDKGYTEMHFPVIQILNSALKYKCTGRVSSEEIK